MNQSIHDFNQLEWIYRNGFYLHLFLFTAEIAESAEKNI